MHVVDPRLNSSQFTNIYDRFPNSHLEAEAVVLEFLCQSIAAHGIVSCAELSTEASLPSVCILPTVSSTPSLFLMYRQAPEV